MSEFDDFMYEAFGKKRKQVNRIPPETIKDRILKDMMSDEEMCWILQCNWVDMNINPGRIKNEDKGVWHG